MSTIVENTNPVTVDIEPKYSVTTQSGAIVENKAPEYSVSVQRKEYKVVGDNIYIPRLYDDAPQWMKDLVNTVVDVKTAVAVGNLDDALEALRTLSDELEVAKNTYTNSIISSNDIDQRINTAIETLNSALSDADATIMNIAQTATTPAEASAIALNTLSASLSASGEIGSFISNMNSAFADLDSTTTQSINFMESAINAEFSANATALNTIRTYVGIDGDGNETGTGLAEAITQLGVDIANEAGLRAAGDTTVTNTVKAYADSVGTGVESKWEYGSVLGINGIYKKSGFGLTTNYTSGAGTEANPYVSEFWIDATKLRFTNSNATGRNTPFTIDASGITPEITFNGKVSFSNVTGYTPPDVSGDINANNDVFAQRLGYANYAAMVAAASSGQTIINGGYIGTNLVKSSSILANSVSADRLMAGTNNSTVWTGGGLVSANFNGNTYGNIGSPTAGFRLSSNAVGTETDPNIYGAYIKGSTVDIETLSVKATGYPGNSGRVVKYQKNGYIYMPGYGSGFLASRVCSQSESAIKVEGWYRAATNYLVAYLQYSTDGVNWLNLAVKYAQQYGYQEYFYIYFAELFNPSLVTATSQVTFRIIGNVGGSASDILISIYNN